MTFVDCASGVFRGICFIGVFIAVDLDGVIEGRGLTTQCEVISFNLIFIVGLCLIRGGKAPEERKK